MWSAVRHTNRSSTTHRTPRARRHTPARQPATGRRTAISSARSRRSARISSAATRSASAGIPSPVSSTVTRTSSPSGSTSTATEPATVALLGTGLLTVALGFLGLGAQRVALRPQILHLALGVDGVPHPCRGVAEGLQDARGAFLDGTENLQRAALDGAQAVAEGGSDENQGAGNEQQKQRRIPDLAAGRMLAAYALTEPGSGSDAGSLSTSAKRDGDHYVLDGTKRFITNAPVAGLFTVMARTDPDKKGASGISAFSGRVGERVQERERLIDK